MNNFALLLCGFLGAALIRLLWKNARKWHQWLLSIGLYAWLCAGISFVYINAAGYHHKAVTVGITFFGLIAVVWGFVLLRLYGGKKPAGPEAPEAQEGGNA
ncbi:MAG: hypothetical protein LBQ16_00140 [Gracilibacteraceae bacterium]|jgi:peptidoglycan/LPS O-acetylase OafA/YrhL|nr:hypothetical protein [Gracilibacteraceae bacterium]